MQALSPPEASGWGNRRGKRDASTPGATRHTRSGPLVTTLGGWRGDPRDRIFATRPQHAPGPRVGQLRAGLPHLPDDPRHLAFVEGTHRCRAEVAGRGELQRDSRPGLIVG